MFSLLIIFVFFKKKNLDPLLFQKKSHSKIENRKLEFLHLTDFFFIFYVNPLVYK